MLLHFVAKPCYVDIFNNRRNIIPMKEAVKIYPHPGSPYLFAHFPVWDAQRQKWKPAGKSTRCTDPAKALEIGREFYRVALAAGGTDGRTRLSREFVEGVIEDILRISGHRPVAHTKTWAAYSQSWLEAQKKRIPKSLSARTFTNYHGPIKSFNAWLGKDTSLPIASITGDHLQDWYRHNIEAGLSAGTMFNATKLLTAIFQRAIDEGFCTRNPVNLITRDPGSANKRDPFTLEQMDQVLDHLRKTHQHDWLTVALLGFCTSQRLADCVNALRSGFESSPQWWTWNLAQGKTGKTLRIPLVEPLASHLAALMAKPATSLFLAPSLANTDATGRAGLSSQFAQILVDCGIVGRKIEKQGKGRSFHSLTFHSTRHTCNTLLANAGIPFEVRKLITGHGDLATNITYTHLGDDTKGKALTKAFKRSTAKKNA
jgi:integrase